MQGEKIVETKICKHCGVSFDITDKDLEFYEKVSPSFPKSHLVPLIKGEARNEQGDFIKYQIPMPTLCPDCRQQRRLSFRNERKLYKRKCDATGKDIISIYSPDKPYTVYDQDFWWSDKWDAMDYGKDFDFSKGFFEQFDELMREVPKISLSVEKQENTEYSNYSGWNKNCYLIFLGANNENCGYCNGVWTSKSTFDCSYSTGLENCYGIINSIDLYECYFSEVLENCSNCIFCYNLKGKTYHIFNKQVTKEEFNEFKINLKDNLSNSFIKYDKLKMGLIRIENYNLYSKNVTGEYILWSENVFNSYDIVESKNCKYVTWLFRSNNCYDVYDWGDTCELSYEGHKIGNKASKIIFSAFCLSNVSNLLYCYDVVNNCSYCFGCIGLRDKSYCIFNKQYTKEEYEELVPKIIEHMKKTGEWGEFFPSSISPFGYNETVANEYFPISKEKALKENFKWSNYEAPFPKVTKIIPASKLPDDISKIPDDILNRAIECEITKKPFRIIAQELDFYRKHNLPIPRRHPDQRHLDRMALRNPRKLFDRKCDKCGIDIKTTYSPDRSEIVYCEECYNKEIY